MAAPATELFEINRSVWKVPAYYRDLSAIGKGTFGSVCSALHVPSNTRVAIKKLHQSFSHVELCQRTFREIMLLKHLKHDNIIELLDSFATVAPDNSEPDIYLVTNLMGADLHSVLQAQFISDEHVKFITYQILRGLVYLHSAGVIHRDLKPSNIAVSQTCDVKILDFGLARPTGNAGMTGYVQTRWYRAPEIIVSCGYDEKADMWSVGCILGEMLCGAPLFPGQSPIEQVDMLIRALGPLPPALVSSIESPATKQFFLEYKRGQEPQAALGTRLRDCNPSALDLVCKLLTFSSAERLSAKAAIAHPYLDEYHDLADEPEAGSLFDDSIEHRELTVPQWRDLILQQVPLCP